MRDLPALLLLLLLCCCAFSLPISQPAYQNAQYSQAQPVYKQPQTQTLYLQQVQQYLRPQTQQQQQQQIVPVYEAGTNEGLRGYSSQQARPQHILLAANVDRERPLQQPYVQHSLAAQAQEAFAATAAQQRKAQLAAQQSAVPAQHQPEIPQVRYVARPAAAPAQYVQHRQQRPQQLQRLRDREEEKDDYDPNPSYQFGFDVKDDLRTNYQNRKEQREGNKITGSYSVVDSDGFIRTVSYTADPKEGFKAEVTRQPTDIVVKVPKPLPQFQSSPRQQQLQYVQEARPRQQEQRQQQSNVIYQYQ